MFFTMLSSVSAIRHRKNHVQLSNDYDAQCYPGLAKLFDSLEEAEASYTDTDIYED